jgi:polysaccharide chain length determinant protein (PEP-CTERM system associated)
MTDDLELTDSTQPQSQLGLDFVSEVWHRRRRLFVWVFSAVLVAALIVAGSLPDLYRASAKVIVDRQEVSEAFVEPSVTADLETRIQTIDQRVRGRDTLSKVIFAKNLYPELRKVAPIEAVVERLKKDYTLKLEGVGDENGRSTTIAFTVTYGGRDPVLVADVANTLAGLYVDENSRSRKRQAMVTAEFLEKEVERARQAMDTTDRRASEFTRNNADLLPQQVEVNMAALDRLSTDLRQNGEYQLRAIERRERLEKELAESALTGTATSEEAISARLEKLKGDLADLRRSYSDKHPDVIRVQGEIASLEQKAASAPPKANAAPTPAPTASRGSLVRALAEVDEQLKALKEEESRLRRQSASYETRVENAPRRRTEIDRLARGNDSARERYESVLKRYEAARLATNLEDRQDLEQFRILDAAIAPRTPAMPNRLLIVGLGLLAALAAAAAAVVASEKLDTTFHSPTGLSSVVSVPVLATIRIVPTRRATFRRKAKSVLATGAALIVLTLIAAASYYLASGNEDLVRMISRGGA